MRKTKPLTTEQIKAKEARKEQLNNYSKTIKEMSQEQKEAIASNYPIVTVEGHCLSLYNNCFLMQQYQDRAAMYDDLTIPTIVGGYRQWQEQGRQVTKGSKAFSIFIPSQKISKDESGNNKTNEAGENLQEIRFLTANVFDISQTEEINQESINSNEDQEVA